MEKISWTDRVRNEEVSRRARGEEERQMKRRTGNSIGHIKRRTCLLKHVVEGKIERTKRRRRRKQLLDIFKERKILHVERISTTLHSLDEAVDLLVTQRK
jgi:ribosomal protein L13